MKTMRIRKLLSPFRRFYLKAKEQHFLRQFIGFFLFRNNYIVRKNHKVVYVVSTPEYGNLGDHAIAIAEMELLRKCFSNYEIVEIGDTEFLYQYQCLHHLMKSEDIICLIGGGNFGVVYPEVEFVRRKVIQGCPHNKIILFPQTIDFGNSEYARKEFIKSKQIYQKHQRLYLMARERKSYEIMCREFYSNKVLLAPDVVLSWNPHIGTTVNDEILLCFRNDSERVMKNETRKLITDYLNNNQIRYKYLDTEKNRPIKKGERKREVYSMLEEIAAAKFVVTDRLHGMIFSYICGTPCLAFDNCNKKISGVAEWIHCPGILICTSADDIDELLFQISKEPHFECNTFEFETLLMDILKTIEKE